jgi:hypothetical protein
MEKNKDVTGGNRAQEMLYSAPSKCYYMDSEGVKITD